MVCFSCRRHILVLVALCIFLWSSPVKFWRDGALADSASSGVPLASTIHPHYFKFTSQNLCEGGHPTYQFPAVGGTPILRTILQAGQSKNIREVIAGVFHIRLSPNNEHSRSTPPRRLVLSGLGDSIAVRRDSDARGFFAYQFENKSNYDADFDLSAHGCCSSLSI
ncbi:hypothetical protein K438DRAFT_1754102 [Mycena galopus ATCC 62051]|nr:hypothetical protein K438DRAFT_1754102 [Mycena galopus ATCC 62051]